MSRKIHGFINVGAAIALAALLLIGVHEPARAADGAAEGHRLAEAWCETCHAIEPHAVGLSDRAPSFAAVADRHGTTALSLKVFLKTSHHNMPNLVISPEQADALADYILSLKTH